MKQIIFTGNIGKDAELKSFNERSFISFSCANDDARKDKDGKEIPDWVDIVYFPKENSNILNYLKKGTKVLIQGEPYVRAYMKSDLAIGVQCIQCFKLKILNFVHAQEQTQDPLLSQAPVQQDNTQDPLGDLPF